MKFINLVTASITVVIVELLLALVFILLPLLVFGVDISEIGSFILFYLFWVMLVSGSIVLTIGIPIYLVLESKNLASSWNLAAIGFLIPVVIYLVISAIYSVSSGFSSGQNYYGIYREMIVHGERTFWGWISFVEDTIKFGVHGLIGAIVFGKIMLWIKRRRSAV